MRINITAGDLLNEKLKKDGEIWIPFREAMIKGNYTFPLFSKEFCMERSKVHEVTYEEYYSKIKVFIDFLNNIENYSEIYLWFGDEPFCVANSKVVLESIRQKNYKGTIILNIVDENNGTIIKSNLITL